MSFRCTRCKSAQRAELVLGRWCAACATYLLAITHEEPLRAKLWKPCGGVGPLPKHWCTPGCTGVDRYAEPIKARFLAYAQSSAERWKARD